MKVVLLSLDYELTRMNVQKKEGGAATLLRVPSVLKERWHIVRKIGGGGFGEIYEGRVAETGETCAVKVESSATSKQVLKMEAAVLRRLQSANCEHACQFLGAGRTDTVNFVVMSLLGPNLSELRKKQPQGKFSWATTFRLAAQMVAGVQAVHDCGFLHRDIKPSNFVMGSQPNTKHTCYILDFGLARQYVTATGEVREPRPTAGFRGTVRYASISAHRAVELGRHDDLWSLFYLLMEFLHGQLPWRRLKEKEEVAKVKEEFDHHEFLVGLPVEFEMILSHLRRLDYHTCPDYSLLIKLFETMINRYGISSDGPMDWEIGAVADSVPSSSVVSPGACRDGAAMEEAVEGAGENNQMGLANKKVALLNEQDDGTNKTHCSAQENFSGGEGDGKKSVSGHVDREEHPSGERDILHAPVEVVVEGSANPESRDACEGEAEVEIGVSQSGKGNDAGEHSQVSLVRKSDLVIEAASVEKGDSVKEGAVEEKSDGGGGGDSCGDIDEVAHPVMSEHKLVGNGDERETSGDRVRVTSTSSAQFLSVHEVEEEEEEEEEERAVYPEVVGIADGYKARESAFDSAFSAAATTQGEEREAGADCQAVVSVSVGEDSDSVVGGKSENGSYGAKQLCADETSCEANGSREDGGALDGEDGNSVVSQGRASDVRLGDCDHVSDGVDVDGCHSVSGEDENVSDSLQKRLLQVLAENETSHLAPFATTESFPPLPTDYDHLLRDSQWTVTSAGVDRMGTLQQLCDGTRVTRIESSSRAEDHREGESEGCMEKAASIVAGELEGVQGSSSEVQSSKGDLEHSNDGEQLGEESALRPSETEHTCKQPCDDGLRYSGGLEGIVASNGDMPHGDDIGGSDGGGDAEDEEFAAGYSVEEFDEVVSELEESSSESERDTSPQIADRKENETSEVAALASNDVHHIPPEVDSPIIPVEARPPETSHWNSELMKGESSPPNRNVTAVNSVEPISPLSTHSPRPSPSVFTIQKLLGISGFDPWEPVSVPSSPTTGTRPQCSDPRWKRFSAITSNV